jgi:hypothetical protein
LFGSTASCIILCKKVNKQNNKEVAKNVLGIRKPSIAVDSSWHYEVKKSCNKTFEPAMLFKNFVQQKA